MTTYYKVSITMTGKSYRWDDQYTTFDNKEHSFSSLQDVKEYLETTYGNCKRVKMYRDIPGKEHCQTGWIYCFNNSDISHLPVDKWRQQDWVEVTKVKETIVSPEDYGDRALQKTG